MRIGSRGCRTFLILTCPSVHRFVDEVVPVKVLQDVKIRPHLFDCVAAIDDMPVDMFHSLTEGVLPVAMILRGPKLDIIAEPTSATIRESSSKMHVFNVLHPGPEFMSMEGHIASSQPYKLAEQYQRLSIRARFGRLGEREEIAGRVCR